MAPSAHDAFVSYSQRADGRLAAALETGLERLAKPLWRLRAVDVFRDKTGLAASPGLWSGIVAQLEASRWLIYLASPESAASPWCAKELQWWLDHRGSDGLLIVLSGGTLVWHGDDLDWSRSDALPALVRGRLREEPLFVDLRWARTEASLTHRDPRLRPALLDLAAPIRGLPKDTLDGDDVRQLRRTRQLASAAVAGISLAAALAVWQAVEATRERDQANRLRDRALSRQLAAQSAAARVRDPVLALQLAAQAPAVADTVDARGALLGAITALPLARLQQHGSAWVALALRPGSDELVLSDLRGAVYRGALDSAELQTVVPALPGLALFRSVDTIAFAPDGRGWAHAGASGEITLRAGDAQRLIDSGDKVGESNPSQRVLALAYSPDGRWLASASTSGRLMLHALAGGAPRALLDAATDLAAVAFHPSGRWLVAGGDGGFLNAVALDRGTALPRFSSGASSSVIMLAFDASGSRLFVASRAGRIEVFDTATGTRSALLDALEHGALERLALSADARFMVSGHASGALLLWHEDGGAGRWRPALLLRHAAAVRGLAFAADGRRVVSAGADGRVVVTLPVDQGRWQRADGPAPAASSEGESISADGRWMARASGLGSPETRFRVDLGGVSLTETARLSLWRAPQRSVVVDKGALPTEPGLKSVGPPVFAADSSLVALQVADRLAIWDLHANQALDATLPLPPGTNLAGADGRGWLAATPQRTLLAFGLKTAAWRDAACALAGRALTPDQWRQHLGADRPYAPVCR